MLENTEAPLNKNRSWIIKTCKKIKAFSQICSLSFDFSNVLQYSSLIFKNIFFVQCNIGPYLLPIKVRPKNLFLFFNLFKIVFTKVAEIKMDCIYDRSFPNRV